MRKEDAMRYELHVTARQPSKNPDVVDICEKGLKRRYSENLSDAVKEFLQDCVGAGVILRVTIKSAGRFIIESLKPLDDFMQVIQNLLRSRFHTHAKVDCSPL